MRLLFHLLHRYYRMAHVRKWSRAHRKLNDGIISDDQLMVAFYWPLMWIALISFLPNSCLKKKIQKKTLKTKLGRIRNVACFPSDFFTTQQNLQHCWYSARFWFSYDIVIRRASHMSRSPFLLSPLKKKKKTASKDYNHSQGQ